MSDTWAVVMPDVDTTRDHIRDGLELMTLETAVENAKWAAREHGRRFNVYKLVETHTFAGRPK